MLATAYEKSSAIFKRVSKAAKSRKGGVNVPVENVVSGVILGFSLIGLAVIWWRASRTRKPQLEYPRIVYTDVNDFRLLAVKCPQIVYTDVISLIGKRLEPRL